MKKPTIYSFLIDEELFQTVTIVIMCSSIKYLGNHLQDLLKEYIEDNKDALHYANELKEYIDENFPLGLTVDIPSLKGGSINFVLLEGTPNNISLELVIHEMCHVMQNICKTRGIEDAETEAYLIEYLVHRYILYAKDRKKDKVNINK